MRGIYLPLQLVLFLIAFLLIPYALSDYDQVLGETFPSCVEIVNIHPPPYSVLKRLRNKAVWFQITFSKPVFKREVAKGGKEPIFLSPNAVRLEEKRDTKRLYPTLIQHNTTNSRKWGVQFKLESHFFNYFGSIFRTLYLVVDGGSFYAREFITAEATYNVYVPSTIFGQYYTHKKEKLYEGNRTVQPISPSPYCNPADRRPLPEPVGNSGRLEEGISVEIPERGHQLNLTQGTTTLGLLALVNGSSGKETVSLPHSVIAQLQGANHTVKLPLWSLTFDMPFVTVGVRLSYQLVHELRERVYLFRERSYVPQAPPNFLKKLSSNTRPQYPNAHTENSELVEIYDPNSGVKTMEYVKKDQEWYETSYHGTLEGSEELRPDWNHPQRQKSFLQNNMKLCPVNSTRNPGRHGHLYHTLEYGNFFQVLTPRPPNTWFTSKHNPSLVANTSEGRKLDLSKQAEFGWNNKKIPSRLVKAISEDYVCLMKPVNDYWAYFPPEKNCIFVPMKTAQSRECGGLRLFENVEEILEDPEFCNKEFGDCIGLPFSSLDRFPVIPPYGAPELSGWQIMDKRQQVPHPAGNGGPHPEHSRPIISYHQWKEGDGSTSVFYVYPFNHLNQLDVHSIPITEVQVVYPRVEKGKAFCSSVWKVEGAEVITKSYLSATIHNKGEGGGDFIFEVRCSPRLIIHPFVGTIKQWIPPRTSSVVKFRLSGALAAHISKARHKCELTIRVETAPLLSGYAPDLPVCTKWIATYWGAFEDPCKHKRVALPAVDLKYYILPRGQLEPLASDSETQQMANLHAERRFIFVKAITVTLDVPEHQHELVANLKQLHVYCGNPDVLITQTYGEFLVQQAVGALPGITPTRQPFVLYDSSIENRRIYFFTPREWSQTADTEVYSDCWVEVWINRPHPLCNSPTLLSRVAVPLSPADIEALQGPTGGWTYTVYGRLSGGVAALLIWCLLLSAGLFVSAALGHGILFALRKRLPQKSTIKRYQKELDKAHKVDQEYWENPQVYLTKGPNGPYFLLHGFRATDALDTSNLKSLKIAGTLRYKNKELQVLFGHVKKVYLDKSGRSKDIWIEASSGMYLLSPHQVLPEYRAEYCSLLERQGLRVDEAELRRMAEKEQKVTHNTHQRKAGGLGSREGVMALVSRLAEGLKSIGKRVLSRQGRNSSNSE